MTELQRRPRSGRASRALPFQNQQVVRANCNPLFPCPSASSAPWELASNFFLCLIPSPNRIFRYGTLAQTIPSVPRVLFHLFLNCFLASTSAPKLRTSHLLQMPPACTTAASVRVALHPAIPENCGEVAPFFLKDLPQHQCLEFLTTPLVSVCFCLVPPPCPCLCLVHRSHGNVPHFTPPPVALWLPVCVASAFSPPH